MNTNLNLIPRSELEQLLSEYATGTLDKGLRARVEASLDQYPDLRSEVDAIRGAFTLVNKQNYNAAIDYETRNLSVHVINALHRPRRSPLRHLAWLAPAAAAVVLVFATIGNQTDAIEIVDRNATTADVPSGMPAATSSPTLPTVAQTTDTEAEDDTAAEVRVVKRTNRKQVSNSLELQIAREEMIVTDLVSDQIVNRMAIESTEEVNASVTGITDAEIDVLLADVSI